MSRLSQRRKGRTPAKSPEPTLRATSTAKTVHWNELEDWQKDNEYILSGYRRSVSHLKYRNGSQTDVVTVVIEYSIAGEVASPLFSHVTKLVPPVQFTHSHDSLDLHNETGMCHPVRMSFGRN